MKKIKFEEMRDPSLNSYGHYELGAFFAYLLPFDESKKTKKEFIMIVGNQHSDEKKIARFLSEWEELSEDFFDPNFQFSPAYEKDMNFFIKDGFVKNKLTIKDVSIGDYKTEKSITFYSTNDNIPTKDFYSINEEYGLNEIPILVVPKSFKM